MKMNALRIAAIPFAVMALFNVASAEVKGEAQQPYAVPAGANPIVDDGYNGSLASMTCDTVAVATPGLVADINVTVGITHTWIGDLTVKVVNPAGTVVTLLNRPGLTTPDDGSGCCGDSSDALGANALTFDDASADSAEGMGNTISGGVVCRDDGRCTYLPAPDGAVPGGLLSTFNGTPAAGNWRVCVGDGAGGDTGSLDSSVLSITAAAPPVSAPAMNTWGLALLALMLGGVGMLAWRRQS